MPHRRLQLPDIAPSQLPPKHVRLAPERLVRGQAVPAEGYIALIGQDLTGRVRFRIEIECTEQRMVCWWMKVARYALALFYGAAEIRLMG